MKHAQAEFTRVKFMLMSIIPAFLFLTGLIIVGIGSTLTVSHKYTEGNCTLFITHDACMYKVDERPETYIVSCDIMLPSMSLSQYRTHIYPCYYYTPESVTFEPPCETDTRGLMMLGGTIVVFIAGLALVTLGVYNRKKIQGPLV